MRRKALAALAAGVLIALAAAALGPVLPVTLRFHEEVDDFAAMARALNMRNMVAAVYLGPRIADTFLEVMVVVLAVAGMRFIREAP